MANPNDPGARTRRQRMPDDYTAQEIALFENCEPPGRASTTA
ncbi:hypothetical protein [Streptomyces sp. CA-106110]